MKKIITIILLILMISLVGCMQEYELECRNLDNNITKIIYKTSYDEGEALKYGQLDCALETSNVEVEILNVYE